MLTSCHAFFFSDKMTICPNVVSALWWIQRGVFSFHVGKLMFHWKIEHHTFVNKNFGHNWCRSDEDQEDNIIVKAQALTFQQVFDGTHGPIPMFRGFEPLWDPKLSLKRAVCRLVFAEQPFIGMSVEPISYGPIEGPCLGLSDQNEVHQVHLE